MFPFSFSRAANDSDRYTSWRKKRTSRTASSGTSTPSRTWGSQTSLADSLQSTASNVAWQGNSFISPPLTAQLYGRPPSNSSPTHSPVSPSRANKAQRNSPLQTSHNQSVRLDPRMASGSDDGYFSSTMANKQLSPIVEQDYFSPEGRPVPLPAEHPTELQICTPGGSELSETPRTYLWIKLY